MQTPEQSLSGRNVMNDIQYTCSIFVVNAYILFKI